MADGQWKAGQGLGMRVVAVILHRDYTRHQGSSHWQMWSEIVLLSSHTACHKPNIPVPCKHGNLHTETVSNVEDGRLTPGRFHSGLKGSFWL